ncbi:MAG: RsmE family RNA methyltransferase [Planctomycetota bacterium]|nr:RsmE family RNA methyltransferase [Planctomycetota bacterium]
MHHFYCPTLSELPGQGFSLPASDARGALLVYLDLDESRHARKVLRLEPGEVVGLLDGKGRVGTGVLGELAKGQGAEVRVTSYAVVPPPRPAIDLAAAVPKGGHADEMLAALSQLGVGRLVPLRTRRSIVDPRPKKIDRFNRAALESAKQCGRAHLMEIAPIATLTEALAESHDVKLIAAPPTNDAGTALNVPVGQDVDPRSIPARLRSAQRVLILIGPEGGWAPEELDEAARAGCSRWALGPHVMRIETAAAAAAAIAGYAAFHAE